MSRADYFHDGYTQSALIAAVPRLHGALRFTYRPALIEERSQLYDAAGQLNSHLFDCHVARVPGPKDRRLGSGRRTPAAGRPRGRIDAADAARNVRQAESDHPGHRRLGHRSQLAARKRGIGCSTNRPRRRSAGRTIGEIREENDEKNCSWG